jgi:hypothetical protein
VPEPKVQIDDYVLSEAQAMALRVAATDFHSQLQDQEYCDDLGEIGMLYKERITEILKIWLARS